MRLRFASFHSLHFLLLRCTRVNFLPDEEKEQNHSQKAENKNSRKSEEEEEDG